MKINADNSIELDEFEVRDGDTEQFNEAVQLTTVEQTINVMQQWHTQVMKALVQQANVPNEGINIHTSFTNEQNEPIVLSTSAEMIAYKAGITEAVAKLEQFPFYVVDVPSTEPTE